MSLVAQDGRDEFVGNGSNKAFVYTFRILSKNEIEYLEDGVAKTVDTDFTVSGIGDAGGGTVTATVAPANLVAVTVLRKQGIDQDSVYVVNEDFPADRIEQDLDKLAMIAQMLAERVVRSIKIVKESTATEVELVDPKVTGNQGRPLRISGDGSKIETFAASDFGISPNDVITNQGAIIQGGVGGVPEELARVARGDLLVQLVSKLGVLTLGPSGQVVQSNGTDLIFGLVPTHRDRHISAGVDAFLSTDLLEAIVKRVRESGGTTLLFGAIADNEIIQRSGTNLVGTPKPILVQAIHSVRTTVATGSTILPQDDTIPQNTEGDEYLTATITPASTTNRLLIEAQIMCSHSASVIYTMALFQDAVAAALAATAIRAAAFPDLAIVTLTHEMAAGTVSAITFKIRAGATGAGTFTVNGTSGARLYGGVGTSYLRVTELE